MSDLISRADAIEAVRKELVCDGRHETHDKTCRFIADVLLSALPSADAVQGEWIFNPTDAIDLMFAKPKCSECGFESADGGNFCSNCGARMENTK